MAISLDDAVGGEIRLVVYDYSTTPPKPVAERLVYRRPARTLNVRVVGLRKRYAPGDKVDLSLVATNEKGQPVPAVLGVSVHGSAAARRIRSVIRATGRRLRGQLGNLPLGAARCRRLPRRRPGCTTTSTRSAPTTRNASPIIRPTARRR